MGFLSNLFGGSGAYNKALGDLEKNRAAETSVYLKTAYEDPLNDTANAAALKQARDMLMENNQRTAEAAAVTGATDESVARQKAAGTQAVATAASNIAATGTARRDQAMQNYLQASREYANRKAELQMQKEQAKTQALGGLLNAGIGLASSLYAGPAKTVLDIASDAAK
jgi:L-lactate utilization protein LutC